MTAASTPREQCPPSEADWYAEVIYELNGETDYSYGYYKGAKPTRMSELTPGGSKILESHVRRCPRKG